MKRVMSLRVTVVTALPCCLSLSLDFSEVLFVMLWHSSVIYLLDGFLCLRHLSSFLEPVYFYCHIGAILTWLMCHIYTWQWRHWCHNGVLLSQDLLMTEVAVCQSWATAPKIARWASMQMSWWLSDICGCLFTDLSKMTCNGMCSVCLFLSNLQLSSCCHHWSVQTVPPVLVVMLRVTLDKLNERNIIAVHSVNPPSLSPVVV